MQRSQERPLGEGDACPEGSGKVSLARMREKLSGQWERPVQKPRDFGAPEAARSPRWLQQRGRKPARGGGDRAGQARWREVCASL